MKKTVLIFILLGIIAVWLFTKPESPGQAIKFEPVTSITDTPKPQTENQLDYEFQGTAFRTNWFYAETRNLLLISNYHKKLTSLDVSEKSGCKNLINGGFYGKDDNPLGLVITNGKVVSDYEKNMLFNAVFFVQNGKAEISTEIPVNPDLALQTGPLLLTNKQPLKLAINNDEASRRSVAAINDAGQPVFMVIYKPESTYDGPLLGDLPLHLQEIEKNLHITFSSAVNLDGGSASAFRTKNFSLGELTNVGSFFCAQ